MQTLETRLSHYCHALARTSPWLPRTQVPGSHVPVYLPLRPLLRTRGRRGRVEGRLGGPLLGKDLCSCSSGWAGPQRTDSGGPLKARDGVPLEIGTRRRTPLPSAGVGACRRTTSVDASLDLQARTEWNPRTSPTSAQARDPRGPSTGRCRDAWEWGGTVVGVPTRLWELNHQPPGLTTTLPLNPRKPTTTPPPVPSTLTEVPLSSMSGSL